MLIHITRETNTDASTKLLNSHIICVCVYIYISVCRSIKCGEIHIFVFIRSSSARAYVLKVVELSRPVIVDQADGGYNG